MKKPGFSQTLHSTLDVFRGLVQAQRNPVAADCVGLILLKAEHTFFLNWLVILSYIDIFDGLLPIYLYIYMSNRKNPGNTKYVFDGHWFMEIDGNC
jgi:hypothetical protein